MNILSNCIICGNPLSGKQRRFCCEECKNKFFQSYESQVSRGSIKRDELVKYYGGKCSICGYRSSFSTLVFIKDYEVLHLNMRDFANHDMGYLKEKLHGSKLVCKNCASEIANNDIQTINTHKTLGYEDFLANLKHCNIKINDRLILGVSGGVDSTVLADLFYGAGFKAIVIAHLNHGVREEATKDREFVKTLAEKFGYKFESKTIKPPIKGNLENELRKVRRKFLEDIAEKHKAKYIALGHNADDQAETIVLNLTRGAGLAGLGGMSMSAGNIVRPLLNFSREEIQGYAEKNCIKWFEDITNYDLRYKRNLIRHKILPLFAEINPDYLSAIHRTSYIVRKTDEHLTTEARKFIKPKLDITLLNKLDKVLLYQVLISSYVLTAGTREDLTQTHIVLIEELIKNEQGTKELKLPNNIVAKRSYRTLEFLIKKEDNIASNQVQKLEFGKNFFHDWKFLTERTDKKGISKSKEALFIDEALFPVLSIRTWQRGDFIDKEGISGTKKLQDLFTDAKIDKESRRNWPIIVNSKNEVLWVPKLAYSRKMKVSSDKLIKIIAKKG